MTLPLPKQFTKYFKEHDATEIKNLLITAEAVFESRTTNLNIAKNKVGNMTGKIETKPESNYKRLTRFFTIRKSEK